MTALRIGDEPLTPAAVAVAARGPRIEVELTAAALARMAASHRTAERAAAERPVYGRTTGVGANRNVEVDGDLRHHTSRLLRSHAGRLGDPLAAEVVRATILVRLTQMAAGNGGHRLEVADALIGVLRDDALPELRDLGGLGTGDLTVLAQLGLALADSGRLEIEPGDALPLMSSNAATFAVGALAWADIGELLDAGLGVAALTFHALEGNVEAFAAPVAAARPLRGLVAVSRRLRMLTAGAGSPPGSRTRSACAASRRSPAPCTSRSRASTTCSRWRSTPARRTRSSPATRSCTTAASTPPPARWRSRACGSRWSRSRASAARASRT